MWVLKGVLLGLLLLSFETIAFLAFHIYHNLPHGGGATSVDVRVFPINTIHNPWWWVALAVNLAFTCLFFKMRGA
jgi:hypothetical protein